MIGYEFFARFITRFDYGQHTITFIDKKYFDPKYAGTPVPMRLYHQFPEILGCYDGVPGRFGIDTGSRMPLVLNAAWSRRTICARRSPAGWKRRPAGASAARRAASCSRAAVLKLEGVTIDHPLTMISLTRAARALRKLSRTMSAAACSSASS